MQATLSGHFLGRYCPQCDVIRLVFTLLNTLELNTLRRHTTKIQYYARVLLRCYYSFSTSTLTSRVSAASLFDNHSGFSFVAWFVLFDQFPYSEEFLVSSEVQNFGMAFKCPPFLLTFPILF